MTEIDTATFRLKAIGHKGRGRYGGIDVESVRKLAHDRLDQFFDKLDRLKRWGVTVKERHPL